ASPFLDHGRLLSLRVSPGMGIAPGGLIIERLAGFEAFNRGYRYELHCLSPDAGLETEPWLGQALGVDILLPDGRHRPLCGLITEAGRLGSDGGFGRRGVERSQALTGLALEGARL
ncbi:MAG: contractile injection system protein, VgrG/Pvc8 family, partial [Tepidiforma sp.]